jgi:predicted nucleotidyltransferase
VKLKGLSDHETAEVLPEGLILLGFRGSVAHGMYVPPSEPTSVDDKDLMGVYVGPLEHYIGFPKRRCDKAIERFKEPWDIVHYEVRKYVRLLLKSNPNVLSLLWLNDVYYKLVDPLGQLLLDNREVFASRKAFYSFVGYAKAQLHRMEHHEYHGRMGAKRKTLVDRFGYDTKNAAHLIRLLRMGIEFLLDGVLHVERVHDATELLAIKRGEWSLEDVKEAANYLFHKAEEAHIKSRLPAEPDYLAAEAIVMEIVSTYHGLAIGT